MPAPERVPANTREGVARGTHPARLGASAARPLLAARSLKPPGSTPPDSSPSLRTSREERGGSWLDDDSAEEYMSVMAEREETYEERHKRQLREASKRYRERQRAAGLVRVWVRPGREGKEASDARVGRGHGRGHGDGGAAGGAVGGECGGVAQEGGGAGCVRGADGASGPGVGEAWGGAAQRHGPNCRWTRGGGWGVLGGQRRSGCGGGGGGGGGQEGVEEEGLLLVSDEGGGEAPGEGEEDGGVFPGVDGAEVVEGGEQGGHGR